MFLIGLGNCPHIKILKPITHYDINTPISAASEFPPKLFREVKSLTKFKIKNSILLLLAIGCTNFFLTYLTFVA
jgi:hypothetical protein